MDSRVRIDATVRPGDLGNQGEESFAPSTAQDDETPKEHLVWAASAMDLSCEKFAKHVIDKSVESLGFERLKVLLVSGAQLATSDLAEVLRSSPQLEKLDASFCGLTALPEFDIWQQMSHVKILLLHKNHLENWREVERAASPPALEWLSLFDNPIANQPEYFLLVLTYARNLFALDVRVITDTERLEHCPVSKWPEREEWEGIPWVPPAGFRRFGTNSQASSFLFRARPPQVTPQPLELMQEAWDELHTIHLKAQYCSAAVAIQSIWKIHKARVDLSHLRQKFQHSAILLQKCARKFLWKKNMQTYVQNFLADEEELDLLLNAKEMVTLRASKLVEAAVRRWVQKRKERRRVRQAATIISRNMRGFLARKSLLQTYLELDKYPRIYFPASCTWEAIALLNVARAACGLPPVPRDFEFAAADVMAVRMADAMDLPRVKSAVSRILAARNFCLLRPCHSGRYPQYLWDGPIHKLVDDNPPPHVATAYAAVRRRSANVDNHCREVFLASCVPGQHPIHGSDTVSEGPFVVGKSKQTDFRDLYSFGKLLGEGDFGMVYICEVKPGPAWEEELENATDESSSENENGSCSENGDEQGTGPLTFLKERRLLLQKEQKQRQRRRIRFGTGTGIHRQPESVPAGSLGLVVKMVDHQSGWWGNASSICGGAKPWLLLAQELKYLSVLKHPNLVETQKLFVDDYFVYFVVPRFACSLRAAVMFATKFSRRGLGSAVAADVAGQMFSPLAYLHSRRIVHRGVSPDNLVLDKMDMQKEQFRLVFADVYSTARHVEAGTCLTEVIGAPEYWAPEVAKCEYSCPADMWAAGVVVWFVLTKKIPFKSLRRALTEDPEQPLRMPDLAFDLLLGLLCRDAHRRVSAEQASHNEWLSENEAGLVKSTRRRDALLKSKSHGKDVAKLKQGEDVDDEEFDDDDEEANNDGDGSMTQRQDSHEGGASSAHKLKKGMEKTGTQQQLLQDKEEEEQTNWGRPTRFSRHLPEKKMRADERYSMGEKVTVGFSASIRKCRESTTGELAPFESYEWWSEDRCRNMGLDPGDPPCLASDWRRPANSETDGLVYVCPATVADLEEILEAMIKNSPSFAAGNTRKGADRFCDPYEIVAKRSARQLFPELKEGRFRLCIEDGRLCKVEDVLLLRISSPSGKILVGGERIRGDNSDEDSDEDASQEKESNEQRRTVAAQVLIANLAERRVTPKKMESSWRTRRHRQWRLPMIKQRLSSNAGAGSGECPSSTIGGLSELAQTLEFLVSDQLRAKPDALQIFISASEEAALERSESEEYPGVVELQRRYFFDAVINDEAGKAKLSRIGIPNEQSFMVKKQSGEQPVIWSWLTEAECEEVGVQVRVEREKYPHLHGFQPVPATQLLGRPLEQLLHKHGFTRSGMSASENPPRTVARFAGEVARGQLRLCERGPRYGEKRKTGFAQGRISVVPAKFDALSKRRSEAIDVGELRLLEEVLTVRIRSSQGYLLVKTKRKPFRETDQGQLSSQRSSSKSRIVEVGCFPDVVLRPGEDPMVAVRRALDSILRLAQALPARICFGGKHTRADQDRKEGLATLLVHQEVAIQLGEPSSPITCCLMMPGMETEAEALGVNVGKQNQSHSQKPEQEPQVSRLMQYLVEGPACRAGNQDAGELSSDEEGGVAVDAARVTLTLAEKDPALVMFLREAWRIGSRPQRSSAKQPGLRTDQNLGQRNFRDAVWELQPLVSCLCETPRLAERFIMMLLRFGGTGGDASLVRPVPFLPERFVKQASAVLSLQATWRAHRERCLLSCSLRTAATLRRCALCIQRCWRWSVLKRRLELLCGAAAVAKEVKTQNLYIEDRLLMALNLINGVNRYVPMIFENRYTFGCTADDDLVLVVHSRKPQPHRDASDEKEWLVQQRADAGLPKWLCSVIGGLKVLPHDDPLLISSGFSTPGLYGLLQHGAEQDKDHQTVVNLPSLEHAARVAQKAALLSAGDADGLSPALLVSHGQLRWSEFRYKTVAQARRRAVMLFLCTYSAMHREAVPFVPKASLVNTEIGASILRLWDVYGLTWASDSKTSIFRLKSRTMAAQSGIAPLNGRESWKAIKRRDWMGLDQPAKTNASGPVVFAKEASTGSSFGVSTSGLTAVGGPVAHAGARWAPKKKATNGSLPPLPFGLGSLQASSAVAGRDVLSSRGGTPRSSRNLPSSPGEIDYISGVRGGRASSGSARRKNPTFQITMPLSARSTRRSGSRDGQLMRLPPASAPQGYPK